MIVARQFIAWNASKRGIPSRRERYDLVPDLSELGRCSHLPSFCEMQVSASVNAYREHTPWYRKSYRTLRDGFSLNSFQAINAWLRSFNPYGMKRPLPPPKHVSHSRHATRVCGPVAVPPHRPSPLHHFAHSRSPTTRLFAKNRPISGKH
jgi:hypothetical protein